MVNRSGAGSLGSKVTFQRRENVDDGLGSTRGMWVDQFTVAARLTPKFGGNAEGLVASRLVSQQPYNLTVRASGKTRQITAAWRAYDARAGVAVGDNGEQRPNRVFGIKTVVNPDEQNAYLEMLVIEGEDG
ncbi:head-tail adaptor protein [Brucella sp. HL-2]|nr:head-tail adaptor protein [Brucella sp. HL-2]MCV9907054.1 head-tail adaptor protein [Brucella sp. HL-2]